MARSITCHPHVFYRRVAIAHFTQFAGNIAWQRSLWSKAANQKPELVMNWWYCLGYLLLLLLKFWTKCFEQSKKIKQNLTRAGNFDNCSSVFLWLLLQKFYFWKENWELGPIFTQVGHFPNISWFLKLFCNSRDNSYTMFFHTRH